MRRLIIILHFWIVIPLACAQKIQVEPYQVHRTFVNDPTLIEIFRQEQLLESNMQIDSIEVIDATRNGFGQGDLMVIYPSKNMYPLIAVEKKLHNIMSSWEFDENLAFTSPYIHSQDNFGIAEQWKDPFVGMLAFILEGLELYYPQGERIMGSFRYQKDEKIAAIVLWDFSENDLVYRPRKSGGIADTLEAYDILQVVKQDTVFLSDSTLFDAIYIYKTITDTVFVPVFQP